MYELSASCAWHTSNYTIAIPVPREKRAKKFSLPNFVCQIG